MIRVSVWISIVVTAVLFTDAAIGQPAETSDIAVQAE